MNEVDLDISQDVLELATILHRILNKGVTTSDTKQAFNTDRERNALINTDQAAAYTGRSRRTLDREVRLGFWTCIRATEKGHPKFRREDLDKDMEAFRQLGRYQKAVLK